MTISPSSLGRCPPASRGSRCGRPRRRRDAEALELGPVGRVHGGLADGLGEAVILLVAQARQAVQPLAYRRWQRRAPPPPTVSVPARNAQHGWSQRLADRGQRRSSRTGEATRAIPQTLASLYAEARTARAVEPVRPRGSSRSRKRPLGRFRCKCGGFVLVIREVGPFGGASGRTRVEVRDKLCA